MGQFFTIKLKSCFINDMLEIASLFFQLIISMVALWFLGTLFQVILIYS